MHCEVLDCRHNDDNGNCKDSEYVSIDSDGTCDELVIKTKETKEK